jgi:hypothetical protein
MGWPSANAVTGADEGVARAHGVDGLHRPRRHQPRAIRVDPAQAVRAEGHEHGAGTLQAQRFRQRDRLGRGAAQRRDQGLRFQRVDNEQVDQGQQAFAARAERRGIQHRLHARRTGAFEGTRDAGQRQFLLRDQPAQAGHVQALDLFQRQRAVGARDGDDLVLGILGADDDQRHAGHLVGRLGDGTRVHALPLQLLDHRRAVLQQADARRKRHARTQPGRGHRLVGALAAQAGTEALAA